MSKANVFIVLNLGCEMLYVIDQRLKAQCVNLNKSAQILREITIVLLDPTFLQQLSTSTVDRAPLTAHQCRILFKDIACSSIMNLDTASMDKLWDLMTMIFKWQFHTMNVVNRTDILSLTFRHLDGIGKLIPEMQKQILIDETKKYLLHFWNNQLTDEDYIELNNDIAEWLGNFNIKISILLRLGFQKSNGKFFNELLHTEHYSYYSRNLGENIYTKNFSTAKVIQSNELEKRDEETNTASSTGKITNEIEKFLTELNVNREYGSDSGQNLMILDEINCTTDPISPITDKVVNHEFVLIKNTNNHKTIGEILTKLKITDDKKQVEIKSSNSNLDSENEINFTDRLLEMLDESSK